MSDFLAILSDFDTRLFYFLNVKIAAPIFDYFFVWITTKQNWYLPGGLCWLWLMWKGGRKGRVVGMFLILSIVLADQISSSLLKPGLARFRPCKALEGFRLLAHCGSKYGFPSSHASNIAAIGTLWALSYPKSKWFWVMMILVMGTSRIYVGVHYPFDVLGGWILGGIIGYALFYLSQSIIKKEKNIFFGKKI